MDDHSAPVPLRAWTGRVDGEGPDHARWHQRVRPAQRTRGSSAPHVAVVGFRTDEGVRRNGGRAGAADGPEALRSALAPMVPHPSIARGDVQLVDHGDAVTVGEDLETGHRDAAAMIASALGAPGSLLTVVLGGGHETAWACYLGLVSFLGAGTDAPEARPRWGVLNLDAHFDLRREDRATSGTPFLQMAEAERAAGRDLAYAVLGISEASNTGALFDTARELGVRWLTDLECLDGGTGAVQSFVEEVVADLDVLYLTIDLDVLPAAAAPGVSAPAGLGVPLPLIVTAVRAAAASGKLALIDVVELNPGLDVDSRTARTAARLIDLAVRQHLAAAPSGV
ncbi:formimidoylglutamase [Brachybacterium sp. p3-SID1565]|uniref:Formimidoylglutamase n=1 Tax=Brachybacterium epidermidis TaxID=2781983 RepID=A0ABR9W009_9MICO|nr:MULTISPECIES: formimidoylglutamase [Brachybacterium]MBE9403749.1 formimidoylglutamase [Brachybacterium epidermidis]MCT1384809.1 formimidoylglutamase [Brachybacterium sp. p3-SID1565]